MITIKIKSKTTTNISEFASERATFHHSFACGIPPASIFDPTSQMASSSPADAIETAILPIRKDVGEFLQPLFDPLFTVGGPSPRRKSRRTHRVMQ